MGTVTAGEDTQYRTDDELKQLAWSIVAGRVYTDRHLPEGHPASMVFMILAFLSAEQRQSLIAREPVLIYEYLSEAGERSGNGQPMFLTCNFVYAPEWPKLREYIEAYVVAKASV